MAAIENAQTSSAVSLTAAERFVRDLCRNFTNFVVCYRKISKESVHFKMNYFFGKKHTRVDRTQNTNVKITYID